MPRSTVLLVTALLALALAPFPTSTAEASCAAPYLDVDQGLLLERGASATVKGRAFVDGCRDAMSCGGFGCDDCEYADPPEVPYSDVTLRLVQGERSWPLGSADAGTAEDQQLGQVTWAFDVPPDAEPGRARLVADHGAVARVRIG